MQRKTTLIEKYCPVIREKMHIDVLPKGDDGFDFVRDKEKLPTKAKLLDM